MILSARPPEYFLLLHNTNWEQDFPSNHFTRERWLGFKTRLSATAALWLWIRTFLFNIAKEWPTIHRLPRKKKKKEGLVGECLELCIRNPSKRLACMRKEKNAPWLFVLCYLKDHGSFLSNIYSPGLICLSPNASIPLIWPDPKHSSRLNSISLSSRNQGSLTRKSRA